MSISKDPGVLHIANSPPPESPEFGTLNVSSKARDEALDFLEKYRDESSAALGFDKVYMARLRRKIDWRFLPFGFIAITFNIIDKVLLNYGNVMGLSTELHLKGNDFSNASSAFYIANCVFAVFNSKFPNRLISQSALLLQRLPTAKWLATSLGIWAIATSCTAAVQNYHGLLATRIVSGAIESTVPPALMLLTAQWYTKSEQASRYNLWFLGTGFGQTLGGLFSWAFQHVSPHAPLSGWRIMFLTLGIATFVFAVVTFLFLPDTPMQARFLSNEEKVALLEHVKQNQTGVEGKKFIPGQLLEAVLDIQIWIFFFTFLFGGVGGGVITTYSSTILKNLGYTPKRSALLLMATGPMTIVGALFVGYGVRYFGNRWAFIGVILVFSVLGSALLAFPRGNIAACGFAGILFADLLVSQTATIYQWLSANTAGHTKRAYSAAMLQVAFAIGSIIGPQTFQAKDAPNYQPAKIALMCFLAAEVVGISFLRIYYEVCNKNRDKLAKAAGEDVADTTAYAGMTDKQNITFRYVY
ncbi:MAG: hypothetical protein M1820_004238 [Bogoriella megaspora]|nr:MAG: hypothetical protein M1820_004238 [Bogoriella megaspora]